MARNIKSIVMYGDRIVITYTDGTTEKRNYSVSKEGLYIRAEYQSYQVTKKEKEHKRTRNVLYISSWIAVAILGILSLMPQSLLIAEITKYFFMYLIFASAAGIVENVIAGDYQNKRDNITENLLEFDEMIEKYPNTFLTTYFFYDMDLSHKKGTPRYDEVKEELSNEIARNLYNFSKVRITKEELNEDEVIKSNENMNEIEEVEFEMVPAKKLVKVLKKTR